MKILAQHGFGPSDKLSRGFTEGVIQGAILSPRYMKRDNVAERIADVKGNAFFDPELFAARFISHPNSNLGSLESWNYFRLPRRSQLISGIAIDAWLENVLNEQNALGLNELIAPNLYVESADSIDAGIALNIIGRTKSVASKCGAKPVFATLAISRDAILQKAQFQEIFDAITAVENPPDGYYIIVGSQSTQNEVRSDIYNSRVIAGWMYMNYVLSINGARVINGYCHLLSPLLAICGAEATASGWSSGLRQFSLDRYVRDPNSFARSPVIRYVSNSLMARVKHADYLGFKATLPAVSNGLALDSKYDSEPTRSDEALQSWEALSSLSSLYGFSDMASNLDRFSASVQQAIDLWTQLQYTGFTQDIEANKDRLESMQRAISIFKEWAELD